MYRPARLVNNPKFARRPVLKDPFYQHVNGPEHQIVAVNAPVFEFKKLPPLVFPSSSSSRILDSPATCRCQTDSLTRRERTTSTTCECVCVLLLLLRLLLSLLWCVAVQDRCAGQSPGPRYEWSSTLDEYFNRDARELAIRTHSSWWRDVVQHKFKKNNGLKCKYWTRFRIFINLIVIITFYSLISWFFTLSENITRCRQSPSKKNGTFHSFNHWFCIFLDSGAVTIPWFNNYSDSCSWPFRLITPLKQFNVHSQTITLWL